MTVAFIAFLFIQERGYEIYKENVKNDQQSKTLYVSCDDKHSIMDISELFINNATLPRVKVATVSDSKYTGIFWLDEYAEICYTPYGRRFTAQEMLSGAPVALLGTGYISQLDN
jgi:hypothetical protein